MMPTPLSLSRAIVLLLQNSRPPSLYTSRNPPCSLHAAAQLPAVHPHASSVPSTHPFLPFATAISAGANGWPAINNPPSPSSDRLSTAAGILTTLFTSNVLPPSALLSSKK